MHLLTRPMHSESAAGRLASNFVANAAAWLHSEQSSVGIQGPMKEQWLVVEVFPNVYPQCHTRFVNFERVVACWALLT